MILDRYFKSTIERDFFGMFAGDHLGSGSGREVYAFGLDDKYVIKFENGAQSFQNIREWDVWCDAEFMDPVIKKWLAPCDRISASGTILIQRRTTPAIKFPDKVPSFLTDLKRSNFGMIGRQFVAHDYGVHLVCNSGLTKRLRKADWRDD